MQHMASFGESQQHPQHSLLHAFTFIAGEPTITSHPEHLVMAFIQGGRLGGARGSARSTRERAEHVGVRGARGSTRSTRERREYAGARGITRSTRERAAHAGVRGARGSAGARWSAGKWERAGAQRNAGKRGRGSAAERGKERARGSAGARWERRSTVVKEVHKFPSKPTELN